MKDITDPALLDIFDAYPELVRERLLMLRSLIFQVANEQNPPIELEETIRWSEPAYLCRMGSTIRLGHPNLQKRGNKPVVYGMYFNCKTSIVETILEVYGSTMVCEGNRAVLFEVDQTLNLVSIRQCILLALTYHQRKHLPLLGM